MADQEVIFCFVRFRDKLLLVRRKKGYLSYEERWGVIMGFPDEGGNTKDIAFKELEKFTSLPRNRFTFVKDGGVFVASEEGEKWSIHPLLFNVDTDKIKVHKEWEYKWVKNDDIGKIYTVPGFEESLKRLLS